MFDHDPQPTLLVCTHNPRPDYLERVLDACLAQSCEGLTPEITIVDSGSNPAIRDLNERFSSIKIVRSDVAGLARARLLGIRSTCGDPVLFVDDDTVLDANYLKESLNILHQRSYLGAIGGQLIPEYEGRLPLDESYYRRFLAIREFSEAAWSNRWDDSLSSPIGGGMVVRRAVANAWADRAEKSSWRIGLGRTKTTLSGGEDIDVVHMACSMGFGKGIFPELKLTHLMPAIRLTPDFLVKIYHGNSKSGEYLNAMLNRNTSVPPNRLRHRIKILIEGLMKSDLERKFFYAGYQGRIEGLRLAQDHLKNDHL